MLMIIDKSILILTIIVTAILIITMKTLVKGGDQAKRDMVIYPN